MLFRNIILSVFIMIGYQSVAQYEVLEQLEGVWVNNEGSDKMEIWEKTKEGFSGKSVIVYETGKEEVWEVLSIYTKEGELTYKADVEGNEKAIDFTLSYISTTEVVFSNEKHDFPKHIHYHFIGENQLKVEVYAKQDGRKLVFEFTRKTT